ncbi:UNVERIFIED_CONTAM: AdipoR [Trichonephila clavipes]
MRKMDLPVEDIYANNVSLPEPLPDVFEELSFSDSSEFLEVDEDTSLRKRLFPQILPGSLLNQNLLINLKSLNAPNLCDLDKEKIIRFTSEFVQGGDSDDFGSLDMSLPARAAEQAENIVRKVLEEAENAEQLVRKIWGGAWKVCHFSHLPKWLQDNDFLHKGHRPPLRSFSACFRSIFRIHTETGNIWTHLLGCLLFVGIAAYFLSRPSGLIPWEEKVVFATFFASAIICLGMSSMFHTVSCHSEHIGRLFSKLDYCGIAVLIIGSFVPWLYYGFYCDYQPKVFYFVLVSVLGAASIIVSMWDKFSEPQFRWLRAAITRREII